MQTSYSLEQLPRPSTTKNWRVGTKTPGRSVKSGTNFDSVQIPAYLYPNNAKSGGKAIKYKSASNLILKKNMKNWITEKNHNVKNL